MARNEPNPTRTELTRISQQGQQGELGRSGEPDPVEMLTDEHDRLQLLLNEFEGDDRSEKRTLLKRICEELEAHLRMEEEVFYPWISSLNDAAWQAVDKVKGDHRMLKEALGDIRAMKRMDERFNQRFGELETLIERHADRDEREVYPSTYDLMQSDLEQIGRRMLDLRERLLGRARA